MADRGRDEPGREPDAAEIERRQDVKRATRIFVRLVARIRREDEGRPVLELVA